MRLIDADAMVKEIEKAAIRVGRHYQKRRNGKPYIDGCRILLANVKELLSNSPTTFDVEKVIEQLEEELKLADDEKARCIKENPMQFDSAKGYASGIAVAIEIVKRGGRDEE